MLLALAACTNAPEPAGIHGDWLAIDGFVKLSETTVVTIEGDRWIKHHVPDRGEYMAGALDCRISPYYIISEDLYDNNVWQFKYRMSESEYTVSRNLSLEGSRLRVDEGDYRAMLQRTGTNVRARSCRRDATGAYMGIDCDTGESTGFYGVVQGGLLYPADYSGGCLIVGSEPAEGYGKYVLWSRGNYMEERGYGKSPDDVLSYKRTDIPVCN